jgi:hypothetical protein
MLLYIRYNNKILVLLLSIITLSIHAMDHIKQSIDLHFTFRKLTQTDWPLMLT